MNARRNELLTRGSLNWLYRYFFLILIVSSSGTDSADNQQHDKAAAKHLGSSIVETGQRVTTISAESQIQDLESLLDELPTTTSAAMSLHEDGRDGQLQATSATSTGGSMAATETGALVSGQEQPSTVQSTTSPSALIKSTTTTTTTSGPETGPTTTMMPPTRANDIKTTKSPLECIKDSYCLNGGTCVITESGQMSCLCPAEFYGARCQTRNICKTAIVGSKTGEQICAGIDRECLKNDKFFRCECHEDEYFIFKPPDQLQQQQQQSSQQQQSNLFKKTTPMMSASSEPSTFAYDANLLVPLDGSSSSPLMPNEAVEKLSSSKPSEEESEKQQAPNYVAQCFKVDKCLGVRCRQMSEVCAEGVCECNRNQAFLRDPWDGLCKLLDPCLLPRRPDEGPICGDQAQCVATYDWDLYKCICPIGFRALKVGSQRSSTQCVPLTDLICNVPLLNKCQHLCNIDRLTNSYKCSCLPGYKPGTRPGLDDHMCFFDEQLSETDSSGGGSFESAFEHAYGSTIDPYYRQQQQQQKKMRHVHAYDQPEQAQQQQTEGQTEKTEYTFRVYVRDDNNNDDDAADDGQSDSVARAERDINSYRKNDWTKYFKGRKFNYLPSDKRQPIYRPLDEMEGKEKRGQQTRSRANHHRDMIIRREPVVGDAAASKSSMQQRTNVDANDDNDDDDADADDLGARIGARDYLASSQVTTMTATTTTSLSSVTLVQSSSATGTSNQHGKSSLAGNKLSASAPAASPIIQSWLTPQDRCNMYCEENKICVLEAGSSDSYRCVCDRQGFVSVGDRCLDWCEAAEFSHTVQFALEKVCYSGLCRKTERDHLLGATFNHNHNHNHIHIHNHNHAHNSNPINNNHNNMNNNMNSNINNNYNNNNDINNIIIQIDRHRTSLLERQIEELLALERQSSWRPSFECDCSSSPALSQEPKSGLCKLNFTEIIRPCLPGNEGYQDCVVNKHSYCTVLHKNTQMFLRDLLSEQLLDSAGGVGVATPSKHDSNTLRQTPSSSASASSRHYQGDLLASHQSRQQQMANTSTVKKLASLLKAKAEKLYTCVCSPEKKFLVDKPRNKARCIDECDLLNVECGRFNRMCRAATIEGDHSSFGRMPLVRMDRDGAIRMNQFKRTGCECLPGFNVGPTESLDFTLDDNYPSSANSSSTTTASPMASPASSNILMADQFAAAAAMQAAGFIASEFSGPELEHFRTRYMNINSRCLLDYDVVEFHASFKAPNNFELAWLSEGKLRRALGAAQTKSPSAEAPPPHPPEEERDSEAPSFYQKSHNQQHQQQADFCRTSEECLLKMPTFMRANIADFHSSAVLVAQCDAALAPLSIEMYRACARYRYWIVQKLRVHFADWRGIMTRSLKETFDLMEGNIRLRVNKCQATLKRIETVPDAYEASLEQPQELASTTSKPGEISSLLDATMNLIGDQAARNRLKKSPSGGSLSSSATISGDTQNNRKTTLTNNERTPNKAPLRTVLVSEYDPYDPYALVDADVNCELTIHSASDESDSHRHARKVLLEKQLPKFIFDKPAERFINNDNRSFIGPLDKQQSAQYYYYLMAPNSLIQRDSFDQLAKHRKQFSPCESDYAYCDRQTRCEMVDTVNFSCTCEYGYTPIGSRDIYLGDSRKEVCEDIDECLFDVCKENGLENKSTCVNEIGDYRCQCIRHHVGDNKRYCNHICNVIACKFGDCRIPDEHHAFCECQEGYREADCSVQDPSVALRKANMIICGSIFTSVLLLAITLAISLNSQLKKTKKKLKRLELVHEATQLFELPSQQTPFSRPRVSKVSSGS